MNRIREVAKQRSLSLEQVAERAGVSVRTVYNAAGGRKSNRSTKKLIARALRSTEENIWPQQPDSNYSGNTQEVAPA